MCAMKTNSRQSERLETREEFLELRSRTSPPNAFTLPLSGIAIVVAPFVSDANAVADDNAAPYSINQQSHLGVVGRVNLGSFYTPAKYVDMVAGWLKKHVIDETWTIADLSCGYGAFFERVVIVGHQPFSVKEIA